MSQRTVSGRPSQMQVAIPGHNFDEPPRSISGRPSQMQVTAPGQNYEPAFLTTQTGRPPQMQVGAPSQRYGDYSTSTISSHSSMQVGLPTQRYDPPRSTVSGRPSQMQVAQPTQRNESYGAPSTRQSQTQRGSSTHTGSSSQHGNQTRRGTVNNYINIQIPPSALQGIKEGQASSYSPSQNTQSTRTQPSGGMQPTFIADSSPSNNARTFVADRPSSGRTQIVRPGEPHHFGSGSDSYSGAIFVTLCRCSVPFSHGDAYTMLNSPRGHDIYGVPIDWQEAKKRMLDHYGAGTQQISHQQELDAMPYVFDEITAREYLRQERELEEAVRRGDGVRVNEEGNQTSWHR